MRKLARAHSDKTLQKDPHPRFASLTDPPRREGLRIGRPWQVSPTLTQNCRIAIVCVCQRFAGFTLTQGRRMETSEKNAGQAGLRKDCFSIVGDGFHAVPVRGRP